MDFEEQRRRHNIATRKWRLEHREHQTRLSKQWRVEHPEKTAIYSQKHRAANYQKALEADRKRKRATKVFINSLKNSACVDCGMFYPPYVMDFDHREGTDKCFDVSNPKTSNRNKILLEVQKCDLVCANCHRTRTYQRLEKSYDHLRNGIKV